jgi:hypothetical protein
VLFWNTPLHPIVLLTATGVDRVEQALRDRITLIEQQLPDRVRATISQIRSQVGCAIACFVL